MFFLLIVWYVVHILLAHKKVRTYTELYSSCDQNAIRSGGSLQNHQLLSLCANINFFAENCLPGLRHFPIS